ncbi:ribosomal protein S18-alanine N-acetyltransferase [Streptococcus massiliensis]|uniref:[Ribosomal protein bS18]-alanine N-acetyltransferase n=1 Tax=Streptococcus massiliensis TaxID=313439 RepID=A0A380KZ48_9STRE|nr:ribosomal protein S18-alanine N-acetyltransferase [Streptococcus massiliensis]SUN76569.1 ribosomal-protein-alanine acetyltransferase [Streptococcus massiliensis]
MIKIEKYEPNDQVEQIADKIYQVMTDVYEVSPWTKEQLARDLTAPYSSYFLAWEAENLVGFLAILSSDFEAEILQIAIKRAYQGQGIATALFEHLPADKELFLEVRQSNSPALLFYQKEKFKEIARRKSYYHEPVEDAIIMKRETNER